MTPVASAAGISAPASAAASSAARARAATRGRSILPLKWPAMASAAGPWAAMVKRPSVVGRSTGTSASATADVSLPDSDDSGVWRRRDLAVVAGGDDRRPLPDLQGTPGRDQRAAQPEREGTGFVETQQDVGARVGGATHHRLPAAEEQGRPDEDQEREGTGRAAGRRPRHRSQHGIGWRRAGWLPLQDASIGHSTMPGPWAWVSVQYRRTMDAE